MKRIFNCVRCGRLLKGHVRLCGQYVEEGYVAIMPYMETLPFIPEDPATTKDKLKEG